MINTVMLCCNILCTYQVLRKAFVPERVALGLFNGDASGCYGNMTLFRRNLPVLSNCDEARQKLRESVAVGLTFNVRQW